MTAAQVCASGYAQGVRSVDGTLANAVYAEYGISRQWVGESARAPDTGIGPYEIDHLIPLELGGSNSVLNLWPQAASYPKLFAPGYAAKDRLENALHALVCARRLSLEAAQRRILAAYRPA